MNIKDEIIKLNILTPKDLNKWMKSNIKYKKFTKLMTPEEVFENRNGSCHDQTLFEKYIISGMGYKCGTIFFIEYNEKENAGGQTHTFLYYHDKDKIYWFENAWGDMSGINGPYKDIKELKKSILNIHEKQSSFKKYPKLEFSAIPKIEYGIDLKEFVNACLESYSGRIDIMDISIENESFITDSAVIQEYEKHPIMNFPKYEWDMEKQTLGAGHIVKTTRVSDEQGKYKKSQIYDTPWGDTIQIKRVTTYNKLSQHPHLNKLKDLEKREIKLFSEDVNKPYDVVELDIYRENILESFLDTMMKDDDHEVLESFIADRELFTAPMISALMAVLENYIPSDKFDIDIDEDGIKTMKDPYSTDYLLDMHNIIATESYNGDVDALISSLAVDFNEMIATESVVFKANQKMPVYVLLVHTKTIMSNLVDKFTGGDEFTHASIAFNSNLNKLYSFGAQNYGEKKNNPLASGFTVDNIYDDIWKDIHYGLYVTFVDQKEYIEMMNHVRMYSLVRDKYKFNLSGLVKYAMGVDASTKNKLFCSQFVAEIVNSTKQKTTNPSSSTKPEDFVHDENFYMISKGFCRDYKPAETDIITKAIKKKLNIEE